MIYPGLIVPSALLLPCTYWFAGQCALWDKAEIDYRLAHGGESIRHGPMWRFRAAIVGVPAIVLGMLLGGWLTALCMAAGCAAVFAMRHRYRLNKLRGLDWRYIAPWSNVYDRIWYREKTDWLEWTKDRYGKFGCERITEAIHRAGTITYITEITITLAAVVGVIMSAL